MDIKASESFLRGGKWPTLTVDSAGHAVHVFVNGHFYGMKHSFTKSLLRKQLFHHFLFERYRIRLWDKRKQKVFI